MTMEQLPVDPTGDTSVNAVFTLIHAAQQNPELVMIIAAVALGKWIKSTQRIADELIPVIVIIATGLISFAITSHTLDGFVNGLMYGGMTVATHQSFKQLRRTKKKSTKKTTSTKASKKKETPPDEEAS